jgi:hypothetical protein
LKRAEIKGEPARTSPTEILQMESLLGKENWGLCDFVDIPLKK